MNIRVLEISPVECLLDIQSRALLRNVRCHRKAQDSTGIISLVPDTPGDTKYDE